ncbi:MAG TPA: hypothetical protein VEQ85_13275, partial [Lacipirellulaceae bacterium]|nr:hypothetical protein [Lacipirellulaceae bacterium]
MGLTARGLAADSGTPAAAETPPTLLDGMEGPRPVLVLIDGPPGAQVLRQAVEQGDGHYGAAEHLTLALPPGQTAALGYPVHSAPVIDELRLEAWVWCSRPGVQLGAVVVLPRSVDPATGNPRELILRSDVTAPAGSWQRLYLEGVPKLLQRHARVARAKYGPDVNEAGAAISHLVVLAPGGSGPTDVWVDQVALYGVLQTRTNPPGGRSTGDAEVDLAAAWSQATGAAEGASARTPRRDPPAMPRIIEWQGEPFALLQGMGFDAVRMGRLANATELAEAERLGLWLVCPPPPLEVIDARGIGPEYDGVLAWDLGELADDSDVALATEWARAIRRREAAQTRPIVLRPSAMPREASRLAEVVVLGRPMVGSTASWDEYSAWLARTRRLGRPGAATWAAVDTQRTPNVAAQLAALGAVNPAAGPASYAHLSRAITSAVTARPRGFWFQSQTSLAAPDPETRMRALALVLTNLRLGMIEPWLAGGKLATPAMSSRGDLTALVLTVERSHLVIPIRWTDRRADAPAAPLGIAAPRGAGLRSYEPAAAAVAQRMPGHGGNAAYQDESVTFVLPSVPESCEAHLLTVAGPRQAPTRRVTGGLSVTVPQLPDDGELLLTEDGYAFPQVERYLRQYAAQGARARVELAALSRQQARAAAHGMSAGLFQMVGAQHELAAADAAMAAVHRTLASQDFAAAFARAEQADGALEALRQRVYRTMWPDEDLGTSPARGDWSSLPVLEQAAILAAGSAQPFSLVPAGEFESLEDLLQAGWRRSEAQQPGIAGAVRLSPDTPHGGQYCLELEARATAGTGAPPALATAPVWITSPSLQAPPG